MTCDNCGRPTEALGPCPCALGDECPNAGVCDRCRRFIARNAADRRTQARTRPIPRGAT